MAPLEDLLKPEDVEKLKDIGEEGDKNKPPKPEELDVEQMIKKAKERVASFVDEEVKKAKGESEEDVLKREQDLLKKGETRKKLKKISNKTIKRVAQKEWVKKHRAIIEKEERQNQIPRKKPIKEEYKPSEEYLKYQEEKQKTNRKTTKKATNKLISGMIEHSKKNNYGKKTEKQKEAWTDEDEKKIQQLSKERSEIIKQIEEERNKEELIKLQQRYNQLLIEETNLSEIKYKIENKKESGEKETWTTEDEKTYQAGSVVDLTNKEFKEIDSEEANSKEWQHKESEEESGEREKEDVELEDGDEGKETEENNKEEEDEGTEDKESVWTKLRKSIERRMDRFSKRKEKGLEPILSDEEIEELKKEAQESEEKKQEVREKILARLETEKKTEAQESSFYGKANKGLDWWENLGKNEKGWKGFGKRFFKTGVNLALIGVISSVSVEKAAQMGIGTAATLGGGTTAYLINKIGLGLGIAALMESAGGEKMSPKTKKIIQGVMLVGVIGAGALVAGGGLAVPLAAGAGMLASRIAQREYSEERTKRKKEEKMEKILKKYDPEKLSGNLEKIEDEINQTIGQWEERRKFWGKVLRGGLALGTSIAFLEVSGVNNPETEHLNNDNLNEGSRFQGEEITKAVEQTNEGTGISENPTGETEGSEQATSPEEANFEETNPESSIEINEINFEKLNITFENGAGGIKGIEQLQKQIQEQVNAGEIDLDKAPASVQEFMKEDPTQMAIILGFFNPGDEAESLSVFEGSTLGFDENGNLSYHDIKTGEDYLLINNNGEVTSYDGRMFDSNPIPTNPESEIDKELMDQQVAPETENSVGNENTNDDLRSQQINRETGKLMNAQEVNPTPETNPTPESETPTEGTNPETNQNENTIVNKENPYGLSPETLKEVNTTYENNIEKIFPDNESQNAWNQIKNSHSTNAGTVLKMNPEEVKESYKPLISFMQKLKEATNLTPRTETLIQPSETSSQFIKRALEKVAQMGQLDKFKL